MGKIGHHVFKEPAKSVTRQQVLSRYGMSLWIGYGYIQEAGKGTGEYDKYAYPYKKPEGMG
jgi:hypothetical protein